MAPNSAKNPVPQKPTSSARAIAVLNVQPHRVDLDGASYPAAQNSVLLLPKGQHVVHIEAAAPKSTPRP